MAEQLFAHDVTRALTALYTHPDPKTKKEANEWLVDFQLKPGAWQVAYELLSPQLPEEVQFFGVQTLHTKIQREWEALPNETKHGISKDLMARLQSYCSNPSSSLQTSLNTVSSRLCSCVAAVGVRMAPAQWPTLIPDIISLSSPSSSSLSIASKQVALAVLSVLPEELEAGRISQKRKMEAKKVLQDGSKLVLELIRHILRPSAPVYPVLPSPTSSLPSSPSSSLSLSFSENSSPLASPMLSPTGPPNYTQLDSLSASLHVSALKCLRAWVEWGVPITELLIDGGTLLGATFDALSSNELLSYAADVLTELFTPPRQLTSGLVVSSSRLCFDQAIFVEVVRAAIARVLSCVVLYKDALINKKTEVCVALSRVASAIGCGNPSTVLSTEEGIELIHFILSCSSHTDKTVVMPTLEFWEMIASLISSDGLNQLNQLNQRNIVGTITQSLSSLLPILVHQCKFSHDVSPDNISETTRRSYESAERKSEEHEVVDFRIAAIDAFLGVFRAISATKYLQILAETLSPAPPASLTWQTLEACVYATKVVSDENSSVLSGNANSLHLSAQLAEGVADVLAPGVKQQNIPAILAYSFAGLVKSLPHEVWQHAALTNKTVTILISLLSFPIRISSLFLENVAHALVELTDPSLLPRTAAIFSPHLSTIAGACVSNYLPPEIRDFISAAFLSIVQITLSPEQATQAITDMVAAVAARIIQHTNTTHTVSHEATLEVIADVQIMDSLVGSKSMFSLVHSFITLTNLYHLVVLSNQLVDHILQVLETIAQRSYTKEGESVIDVLARLCTSLLTLTTHQSHPRCVSILVSVFVHTRRASPLRALAYAISPKGKNPPPPPLIAPGGAFESVLTQIASFAVSNITAISVETIGAFYWTMTCAAQISPPLPSLSSTLLPSAQAAITNFPRMIDDPLAATYGLAFLALVPIHPLFSSLSLSLCDPLLHLIFTILPKVQERGLIRPLADLLHSLLNHPQFSQQAKNTTHMCIMTSAAFSRFNEEERKRLARIVLGITPKPRFRAMFTDFFNIASGESDLDVLLAYEL